ncbi:MAG: MarR family transcriptional regulator [Akkermansia sp.]
MNKSKELPTCAEAEQLADFVLFTQRSCILNLSSELMDGKISYPQFFLLTYLASEGFLTMSSIAQKMGHSTAAATGMVDKLQDMGYIIRKSAVNDRRKIMVQITDEGQALVTRMRNNIAKDLANIMAHGDHAKDVSFAPSHKTIKKRFF